MIHKLTSDAFAGVLSEPTSPGISPLFRAKIRIGDDSIRCYVKPLPDTIECPVRSIAVQNNEVISEALGYELASSCGFNVPDIAGIITLDQSHIPDVALEKLQALGGGQLQSSYLCWFSKDMVHPNLTQKYDIHTTVPFLMERMVKRLVDDLMKAEDTAKVIAFDDWLKNSDRHPGNLLAFGNKELMLIDHGRIFIYPNWTSTSMGSMGAGTVFMNRLRHLVDSQDPNWSLKLPRKSEMIMAYNSFALSFKESGEAAVRVVLADFFSSSQAEAVITMLSSQHDPIEYVKKSGMVI